MSAAADNALHGAGGCGMAALVFVPAVWLPWWPYLAVPLVWMGWGMFREQAQHREQGWLGWFNGPRLLEAASWGIGGVVAMGVYAILQAFV